jgi:hypothetical protein
MRPKLIMPPDASFFQEVARRGIREIRVSTFTREAKVATFDVDSTVPFTEAFITAYDPEDGMVVECSKSLGNALDKDAFGKAVEAFKGFFESNASRYGMEVLTGRWVPS